MSGGISASTVIAGVGAAASVAGTVGGLMSSGSRAGAQSAAAMSTYQQAILRNQQLELQAEEMRNEAKQREDDAQIQRDQALLKENQIAVSSGAEYTLRRTQADLDRQAEQAARDQANNIEGAAQRTAIESNRKAAVTAGRAKAVMAASGGGVDTDALADILGEGSYAADVATYEGKARARDVRTEADYLHYNASMADYGAEMTLYNAKVAEYGVTLARYGADRTDYQAKLDRRTADNMEWLGGSYMAQGARGASALYGAAGDTMTTGYLTAGANALSIAAKYAPTFMGSSGGDYVVRSAADTMGSYRSMPSSYTNPGMGGELA